ncbi:FG-GAP repeat domain-containing protein [Roseovarius sp. SYSU LYC5161]|uniref:FG-GAP repeat domain-containing protein n=1 Tax=Roseovarius halophilus (ex Wu et al. 2025) TaxID=3376060 RepID=UPI00399BD988
MLDRAASSSVIFVMLQDTWGMSYQMIKKIKQTAVFFQFILVAGCIPGASIDVQDSAIERAPVPTSTELSKENAVPKNLPGRGWDTTRIFADLNHDGYEDYLVMEQTYDMQNQTPMSASGSNIVLYVGTSSGGFVKNNTLIDGQGNGCIHPRKAITNDFNNDGQLDVFVACHGWDTEPFPGEKNQIILSQPNGRFKVRDAANYVGFFHSAASADMNGDGNPDVIVTNNFDKNPVKIWLGREDATFRSTTRFLPAALRKPANYYTVTLPDADGDGRFDLFVGGHEFDNAVTTLFLNESEYGFKAGRKFVIPPVPGQGVVLDAVATGTLGNRILWILRTSGGDGTFYEGVCIQRFDLQTGQSSLAYCDRTSRWFPWLISWQEDGLVFIGSDSRRDDFKLIAK